MDHPALLERANIAIWRVACGEPAEQWIVPDTFGMLRRLGVFTDDEMGDIGNLPVIMPAP